MSIVISTLAIILFYKFAIGNRYRPDVGFSKTQRVGFALLYYSMDHGGEYPYATSSTKVFQVIYDEKYLDSLTYLYLTDKGGKTEYSGVYSSNNVSFDYVSQTNSGLGGDDPADVPLLFSEAASVPSTWTAGVNTTTLDSDCPFGFEGEYVTTLDQHTRFLRPDLKSKVALTSTTFQPAPGVVYKTLVP